MATNVVACVLGLLVLANALQFPRHATRISRELVSDTEYDFIVVGGGVSGLTVADRLTENPSISVLVIEAGPFDNGEEGVAIPGASDPAAYIWQPLTSQPQTALHNRTFLATCARVVGGGSVVNAMVFFRGGKPEYAAWEGLGGKRWDWDGFRTSRRLSENLTLPSGEFAVEANISWVESAHGNQGPVQASYPNYYFPGSANWWNAALSAGITPTDDPNGGSAKGLFWFPTAVDARSRTRSSARINHYERAKASRENYHILAENTAARVLFDDKKAIGVEYLPTNGGDTLTVYASKEVILAAGAIHTTQVLQLSGIDPRKLLDDLGIRIISELPGLEGPDVPVGLIHWTTGNSATITFLKPLSRGTITINSTNPLAQPLVDFRAATDLLDLDLFIALFGKSREIMATPDMQVIRPREGAPFGENVTSTEQLKEIFTARMGVTGGHECCTAAMMPRDMGGVVDPRMKVYGVRGLRVVDTSFWPMLLTAPPLATTYAVGEKIADGIKKEWGLPL
ncbi:hypothetical protein RAB80_014077 [Fusarium oxysporum f. sp. vasinfectum]|nr:hypothetical protein RAB80_014077 [Fusarium oxysporum f. sp. vasinfectum]